MKLSLVLTLLILLGAFWMHHAAEKKLEPQRQEAVLVRASAKAAGLDADIAATAGEARRAGPSPARSGPSSGDTGRNREAQAKAFAQELISFALEMKAREKEQRHAPPDAATQKRMVAMMARFMEMDESSLRTMVEELKSSSALDSKTRSDITGMSVMMLAQQNPESALRLFSEAKDLLDDSKGMGRQVPSMCLSAWSQKDPAAALSWLKKPENAEYLTADTKRAALAGMAAKDPVLAVRTLLDGQLGQPGKEADALTLQMIAAQASPENRRALLDALPPSPPRSAKETGQSLRSQALNGIARSLTEGNFKESIAWLEQSGLTKVQHHELLNSLSGSLYGRDPAPWMEWFGRQTSDPDRLGELTGRAVPEWTRKNFNGVGEWINLQPAGPLRESVTRSFASTLAPHEPESAATWALTLPSNDQRNELLQEIVEKWSSKDAAAAAAFAAAHGVTSGKAE